MFSNFYLGIPRPAPPVVLPPLPTPVLLLTGNGFNRSSNSFLDPYGNQVLTLNMSCTSTTSVWGGSSMAFAGDNPRLEVTDRSGLLNNAFLEDFTVELYVNFTATNNARVVFSKGPPFDSSRVISLVLASGGLSLNLGAGVALFFPWSPTVGVWYRLTVVRDALDLTSLYVDGVRVASAVKASNILTPDPLDLAWRHFNTAPLLGFIDDFAVYSTAIYDPNMLTLPARTSESLFPVDPLAALTGPSISFEGAAGSDFIVDNATGQDILNYQDANSPVTLSTTRERFNNSSGRFNSNGGFIYWGPSTEFNFLLPAYTLELWFNSDDVTGDRYLVEFSAPSTTSKLAVFRRGTALFKKVNGVETLIASTVNPTVWHHLAIQHQGATLSVLLNNSVVDTFFSGVLTPSDSVIIGGQANLGNRFSQGFVGFIDEVRVTRAARYPTTTLPGGPAPLPRDASIHNVVASIHFITGRNSSGSSTFFTSNEALALFADPTTKVFTASQIAAAFTGTPTLGFRAMGFNGSNSVVRYVDSTNNPELYFNATDTGCIEMWISPTRVVGTQVLTAYSGDDTAWSLHMVDNQLRMDWFSTTGAQFTATLAANFVVNTWYHVAAILTVGSIILVVNGSTTATTTRLGTNRVGTSNRLTLGLLLVGTPSPYQGWIANYRITKGATRYTLPFTPPKEPLPRTN